MPRKYVSSCNILPVANVSCYFYVQLQESTDDGIYDVPKSIVSHNTIELAAIPYGQDITEWVRT